MSNRNELTRRSFLQVIGGVGASFVLGSFASIACASPGLKNAAAFAPNAFVKIDPDGKVTLTVSKPDMGQGTRTSMAMLVAEELDVDWSKVVVVQAPGNRALYGSQGTGGSSSVRTMNKRMRDIGAAARAMLVAAAAQQWAVDPATCKTANSMVIGPNGKTLSYGALTTAAAALPVPTDAKLKERSEYKIIGKPTNRVDNASVANGTALFGMDVTPKGCLYAVCLRAPAFGGSPSSIDDSATRKVPGVVDVIKFKSHGEDLTAVVATNTWAALKGKDLLKASWNNPNEAVTSETIRAGLKGALIAHMDTPSGAKVVEATYELPYLAHATMEPMNAVADVRDDSCTVWTGTQAPDRAQTQIASSLGLTPDKVAVNVMLLGGGFGRRSQNEWIGEAVELSRQLKKPVKLLWSRECDMQHDFYRPMSHHGMKGAVDAQGMPVAWSHQYLEAGGRGGDKYSTNTYLPYDIPGAGMRSGGAGAPVPTGPWRSVEHTQIILANECFIDEMAHAAGQDPFEFRRKLIKDTRLRKVLEAAAEKAGWGRPLPSGTGRGIACFSGYGSYAAHVIELSVVGNKVKLHRAVCVIDVGIAVNPRGVEAQAQGACTDGLSTALKAAINIEKGGALESNWDGYEWMRMNDMPKVEVYLVDGGDTFGGMGEVGYPSTPPAVANAIFAATGKRARKFPIKIEELA